MKTVIMKKMLAEFIGTFALVLFGCGSAVFAGAIGFTGTATTTGIGLCFGIAVLMMCYCIGPISGCHVNPAVSFGVWLNKGMTFVEMIQYWIAQLLGALLAAIAIGIISNQWCSFGANEVIAPGNTMGVFAGEILFTFLFVLVVLGSTSKIAPQGFAGIAIGTSLAIVNIAMIPIDNASVNPARSFGPALLQGGAALSQLWIFIAAPLIGGLIAAAVSRIFKK